MYDTYYKIDGRDYYYQDYKRFDPPEVNYQSQRIAYNQNGVPDGGRSCSIHAVLTVISNITGHFFTWEQRDKIVQEMKDKGYNPEWGWYMSDAVREVTKYCKKEFGLDVVYIRVPIEELSSWVKSGYGVVTGYNYQAGFGTDMTDNGIVGEDYKEYKRLRGGHLLSAWHFKKRKDQRKEVSKDNPIVGHKRKGHVDNYYPDHAHNERFIVNEEHWCFPSCYVFTTKPMTAQNMAQKFSQKYIRRFKKKIADFRSKKK